MRYLRSIIYLSVIVLLYQGIANTDLSIISQFTHQNGNDWAGPFSTALLFIGSGIGSLFNQYIGKYPYKYLLFVGSFGYTLFIATGLIFMKMYFTAGALTLICIGSFIGGLIVSVLYNSQFNYTNTLAKIDGEEVKYFGILGVFTQASNVYGSFLSAMLIGPLGQFHYVIVMDAAIFAISFFFLFLKDPLPEDLNLLVEENSSPKSSPDRSVISSNSTHEERNNSGPYHAIGCFVFTGFIIAFIYNTLSIILYKTFEDSMDETALNRLTFIIFIFEGVGEIIGGLCVVVFSRKITSPAKTYLGIASLFIVAFGIVYMGSLLKNYYIIGLGAVICGVCDCSNMSVALTIAGNWEKKGITAFNIGQCSSVAISTMIMVFLNVPYIPILAIFFYIFCVGSLCH